MNRIAQLIIALAIVLGIGTGCSSFKLGGPTGLETISGQKVAAANGQPIPALKAANPVVPTAPTVTYLGVKFTPFVSASAQALPLLNPQQFSDSLGVTDAAQLPTLVIRLTADATVALLGAKEDVKQHDLFSMVQEMGFSLDTSRPYGTLQSSPLYETGWQAGIGGLRISLPFQEAYVYSAPGRLYVQRVGGTDIDEIKVLVAEHLVDSSAFMVKADGNPIQLGGESIVQAYSLVAVPPTKAAAPKATTK